MIRVEVKLIIVKSLELSSKLIVVSIVNLKVNILAIAIQIKVMSGVEVS